MSGGPRQKAGGTNPLPMSDASLRFAVRAVCLIVGQKSIQDGYSIRLTNRASTLRLRFPETVHAGD